MAVRKTFISLTLKTRRKLIRECSWSEDLSVFIHRFELGSRTCYCKEITVAERELKGGWKGYSRGSKGTTDNDTGEESEK